jgi:hypothetical protein
MSNTELPALGKAAPRALHMAAPVIVLITPKEAVKLLKVSLSWLAKARMRGEGPPYIKFGRSVRYDEVMLLVWMKSQQRMTTREPET